METKDLFSSNGDREPLASRMRPRNLDEYIGQDHIVGKGRLLRRAIQADQLSSVIFYGPPGSGKTTLAKVIAYHTKANFITLNAVLTGVSDIRLAIKEADDYFHLYNRRTILFVDEVHRWNKSQQDALLPWVENGTIILIGATTENPFFEVNKALVSRSRVFQLKGLTKEDLYKASLQALKDKERGYGNWNVKFEEGALEHLIDTANGDARSLLNALELAVETSGDKWDVQGSNPVPPYGSEIYITKEACEESIQKKVVLYDKDGDYHYDIISAFIKSLRGRDPDGAMYWLSRMVRAGEDSHYIFRRMLISACEDTGLADPNAISIVESCARSFDRVGLPEGQYFLAHAALYLATSPKSNSSMAFFDALKSVEEEDCEVPNHLKDSNRDGEGFGHGSGYMYPHAYKDHWIAQQYLPDSLMGRVFYTPSTQGYEALIRDDVLNRREIQIAELLSKSQDTSKSEFGSKPENLWWVNEHFHTGSGPKEENLTFTPKDNSKENLLSRNERDWRNRLDTNRAETLLHIRDTMIESASLLRHYRSLLWQADDGLFIWDLIRKTPEGFTCGLCRNSRGKSVLEQYAKTLGDMEKPLLGVCEALSFSKYNKDSLLSSIEALGDYEYDRVFLRDVFVSEDSILNFASFFKDLKDTNKVLNKNSLIILSQKLPYKAMRLSRLIKNSVTSLDKEMTEVLDIMEKREDLFFTDMSNPLFSWNENTVIKILESKGFTVKYHIEETIEKKRITEEDLKHWFDLNSSSYAKFLKEELSINDLQKVLDILERERTKQVFSWYSTYLYLTIK